MAWIFVVNGGRLAIEDSVGLSDEIMQDAVVQSLKSKAEEHGLIFEETHNSEDDVTSFFVGKEIHQSRHIYHGQTICCDLSSAPDPVFSVILDELKAFLVSKNLTIVADEKGVVINQFD